MRVYISVDMEGVAGVVHEDQTDPVDPRHAGEYNRFRRLMTAEANAAIEGALAAGAEQVVVNDSHWLMMNLLAEELHPAAELLSGGPKARSMVEGVERGFDAALFIGYHARAGVGSAIIDHTYTEPCARSTAQRPAGGRARDQRRARRHLRRPRRPGERRPGAGRGGPRPARPGGRDRDREARGRPVRRAERGAVGGVSADPRGREWASGAGIAVPAPAPIRLEVDFASPRWPTWPSWSGSVRRPGAPWSYAHDDYREVFRAWRALYNLAGIE